METELDLFQRWLLKQRIGWIVALSRAANCVSDHVVRSPRKRAFDHI